MKRVVAVVMLTMAPPLALADDDTAAFKFTTGVYHLSGGGMSSGNAVDFNLRRSSDLGNVWIGGYRGPDHFTQVRAGWDRTFGIGAIRVQPSVQTASGGFWGGSLYAETGERWFAGAGLGRTNLRPYVNLNFDPNDSWTLAGGYRWADNHVVSLLLVGDNRQNPDERHFHVQYRVPIGRDRLMIDVLVKRGLVDGEMIRKVGFTLGYDWPRSFVRLAWDPKVNFTPQDMVRVQAGLRF